MGIESKTYRGYSRTLVPLGCATTGLTNNKNKLVINKILFNIYPKASKKSLKLISP